MRTRAIVLLGLVMVSLVAMPSYTAMPGGIGSQADGGCTCQYSTFILQTVCSRIFLLFIGKCGCCSWHCVLDTRPRA